MSWRLEYAQSLDCCLNLDEIQTNLHQNCYFLSSWIDVYDQQVLVKYMFA